MREMACLGHTQGKDNSMRSPSPLAHLACLLPSAPPPLRTTSSDVRGSSAQRHVPRLAARSSTFTSLRPPTARTLRIHSAILNIPSCPLCAVHFPHLSVTPGHPKSLDDQTQEQADPTGDLLGEEEAGGGREGCESAARAHQPWKHLLHELDPPGRACHSCPKLFLNLMTYACS